MGSFEEQLCEVIRRYPHLYNPTLKAYRDSQMCINSWREIAQTLGEDERVCRQKWKYLRDRYVKAKKKLRGKACVGSWNPCLPPIVSMLSFLSEHIKHRDEESNFARQVKEPSDCLVLNVKGGPADVDEASLATPKPADRASPPPTLSAPSSSPSSSSSCSEPPHPSKRKEPPSDDLQGSLLRRLQQRLQQLDGEKEQENEEASFGRVVASMLLQLPPKDRMDAKFEIHQLLYKKHKELGDHQPGGTVGIEKDDGHKFTAGFIKEDPC
ncbi:transcription factor Adf-1-like [Erpetoichthys calabaricus]|uniref:transcription factor Adf-1-like n=1 Tax=Erpetoichthys calabaricus TaxID=27687 RepID=UPI00109FEB73|nr:transcription factor Adf-1-like [Erpetoichthys calabaricus]